MTIIDWERLLRRTECDARGTLIFGDIAADFLEDLVEREFTSDARAGCRSELRRGARWSRNREPRRIGLGLGHNSPEQAINFIVGVCRINTWISHTMRSREVTAPAWAQSVKSLLRFIRKNCQLGKGTLSVSRRQSPRTKMAVHAVRKFYTDATAKAASTSPV
jgi:hypothetical protein